MERPLYPDDVVALRSDEDLLAVVERTHSEVDTHEPYPGRSEPDRISHDNSIKKNVFNQFMKDGVPPNGAVLVRWQHTPRANLIPESKLVLLDRSLLMGDVVKKNAQDAMSGIVVNTCTKCTIQPVCDLSLRNSTQEHLHLKGLLPPSDAIDSSIRQIKPDPVHNVPASELRYVEPLTEEELVTYKDWIGKVDAVQTAITIRLTDNCVVEISDEDAEHADGALDNFFVGDIATTKKGHLRNGKWIYGRYNPNTMPIGTVVQTRDVSAEVTWLQRRIGSSENLGEPPSQLERDELEAGDFLIYDKTRRPKVRASDSETVSNSEIDVRLGLRVRFKDLSGACVKYDGSSGQGRIKRIDRKDTLGYDINVFDILKFHTDVSVQWQDLSITHERSIDLVPDPTIDDQHAAWPGEIAHTLDFSPVPDMPGISQPGKVGVVQSVSSADRMARVLWCPDACLHYAEDTDTGVKSLLTGVINLAGTEEEEVSLYDVEAPSAMNVRRGDIVLIVRQRNNRVNRLPSAIEMDWVGEIVDTCLDGTLTVRLGAAAEVEDVSLRREDVVVAIRSDGSDEIDDWGDDDMDDEVWARNSEDSDVDASDEEDDEDKSEEEDEIEVRYEDENGEPLDEEDVEDENWESDDVGEEEDQEGDVDMADAPPLTPPTSHSVTPPDSSRFEHMKGSPTSTTSTAAEPTSSPPPAPYLILDGSAPSSHHFASKPSTENTTHLKRVQKEHKILRSADALPHGVYVRTWESRLDLLRVLFIGPAETPYADAPFVIDFYLDSNFPSTPPQAFFHSWTSESGLGGAGRVNPNLYEDGKICLSLLGTWEGTKGEGWNAGRSTLLQVIVSLLGLVLVREPYFNEAGYEPLAHLESSKRASALYNERTYLRARTFVIAALSDNRTQRGALDGLEDVIRWLYRDDGGPRLLPRVIADVEKVLASSEMSGQEPDGLTIMSKGACIPLKRVRDRLREL